MENKDLKKIAESVFQRYPKQNKVFITSDGQAFFNEIHAKNHAVNNRKKVELSVESFSRNDEQKGGESKTTKILLAEIAASESLEELTAILETEKAGDNRKTVTDAAQKKIDKLKVSKE